MTTYYKVLNNDGSARMGRGKWHLPKGKRPGKWMPPVTGEVVPCRNGYHLCEKEDLIYWLGPAIFVAEGRGDKVRSDNKIVFREARTLRKFDTWNERTQRLFAADCAEHVLPLFEKRYPNNPAPRNAIAAARDFANGKIDKEQLRRVADAAYAAAADAAAAAADAAYAAAYAADAYAARENERKWQTKRLFEYLSGRRG